MPIIIPEFPENISFYKRLTQSGAAVISEHSATKQDIRPARIGILNLMPASAMQKTEVQWLKYISYTVLQIEPVLIKFDDDFRESDGASRKDQLLQYTPFSEVVKNGLDGLIITGDNLELNINANAKRELMDFKEIYYSKQLEAVIQWARKNVYSTIYSCLASHFSLQLLYGLERELASAKIFGIFEHQIIGGSESPMTASLDDYIRAPHSRWGNIGTQYLIQAGLRPLAVSDKAGWLLAEGENDANGCDYFIQGHPEYERFDLHEEHIRDKDQEIPVNYYLDNDNTKKPILSWTNDARALHSNWISLLYNNFSE
jgi:homoserine O-succinyltransferase